MVRARRRLGPKRFVHHRNEPFDLLILHPIKLAAAFRLRKRAAALPYDVDKKVERLCRPINLIAQLRARSVKPDEILDFVPKIGHHSALERLIQEHRLQSRVKESE